MRRQAGVTLLELMVALTVLGIIVAAGVPSYQWMTATNQVAATGTDLMSLIRIARSEATRRGGDVVVCPAPEPEAEPTECGEAENWARGAIAVARAGAFTDNGEDELLRVASFSGDIVVPGSAAVSDEIVYKGTGMLAGMEEVEIPLCYSAGSRRSVIQVLGGGAPRFMENPPDDLCEDL